MKAENIICKKLERTIRLFGRNVTEIHFDLMHIHYGWNIYRKDYKLGPPRNDFTADDIVTCFLVATQKKTCEHFERYPDDHIDQRLVYNFHYLGKHHKIVIDLMKNNLTLVRTVYAEEPLPKRRSLQLPRWLKFLKNFQIGYTKNSLGYFAYIHFRRRK